jgi:hypothetical protein
MSEKIGRNDPCWCGSGKKYKKCHYRRDKQEPVTLQAVTEYLKKNHSKAECLHPDAPAKCSGQIIKAHTVQRSGGLTQIAVDGHVYTPYAVTPSFDGVFKIRRTGISRASTFTGFCSYHDNLMFGPIEKQKIEFTNEQIFLLAFRALSKELFIKRRVHESMPFGKKLDSGKDILTQMHIQSDLSDFKLGTDAALADLEYEKARLDKAYSERNYSAMSFYLVEFNTIPDLVCSATYSPHYDFNGNIVQDLMKITLEQERADSLTFSLLPNENEGFALFSWFGDSVSNTEFIKTLHALDDNAIPHAILRFVLGQFENVYISPEWWESQTQDARDSILKRYQSTVDLYAPVDTKRFVDDGVHIINWQVKQRRHNLQLGN